MTQSTKAAVSKGSILIVDDDTKQLRAASRLLQQAGYRVLEASGGEEGQRLAAHHRPELLLVDVVLPEVDGVEICRQESKQTPWLFLPLVTKF